MKIKIVHVTVKKEGNTKGRDWKILEVEAEDGKKYDTFESFDVGEEAEVTVKPNDNPQYNANISRLKLNKGESKKDAQIDKYMGRKEESINFAGAKRDGVQITVALINSGMIKDKNLIKPAIEYWTKYIYGMSLSDTDKQIADASKNTGMNLGNEEAPF